MSKFSKLTSLLLIALTFLSAQAQHSPKRDIQYPNELPNLKIYQDAKWKSIRPLVSTRDDVEQILGEPVPVFDEKFNDYIAGYEYDPDWTIVISYVGKGGELPETVVDRVSHITLFPKMRVSLNGVTFASAFERFTHADRNRNVERKIYYDEFGLRYSLYAKDSPDRRFHAGDLDFIMYKASRAFEEECIASN